MLFEVQDQKVVVLHAGLAQPVGRCVRTWVDSHSDEILYPPDAVCAFHRPA